VRCGGLLSALDPALASKHLDPQSGAVLLHCVGFNDKNHYDRQTPCDQDPVRQFVQDVPAAQWQGWFNGPVQEAFQSYGFFDPAGVFLGDGSYLFVPDNPADEGSVVRWFDAHNHPVDYEKLSPAQRQQAHRERCYKLVSLLHLPAGRQVCGAGPPCLRRWRWCRATRTKTRSSMSWWSSSCGGSVPGCSRN